MGNSFVIGSFMSIVPGKEVPLLTKAGRNSLYIYLCHPYFAALVCFLCKSSGATERNTPVIWCFFLGLATTFCLWACFASNWIKLLFSWFVEPPYERYCLSSPGEDMYALTTS